MGFILGLLLVVAALSSVLLMFVILLQEPKGGGLAAALGGSGMDAIGANVGQVNRFTSWVAGVWIASCFLAAVIHRTGATIDAGATQKPGETSVEKGAETPGEKPDGTKPDGTK